MPLTMKIQPIDSTTPECFEPVKIVPKSRLRRLFDFSSFLRGSAVADRSVAGEPQCGKDCSDEFEPSSVCLDKMVQNFIEESNEKQYVATANKCGRHNHQQCNCVNGTNFCSSDGSEDEFDSFNCFGNSNNHSSSTDSCDPLKSLVLCETVSERNLLADAAKVVDKNKICKRKDEISRKIVSDGLLATGYAVSICKSRWEKTSTYPAGEYEYIDALIEGDRLIIDIDFRSEFEIARSTKSYKAVLQMLPHIFVGKADRLQKIINIVSDAAKQSLKKKGMPLPPWRRAEYVKAKWLSPCTRIIITPTDDQSPNENPIKSDPKDHILMEEFEVLATTDEDPSAEAFKQWEPLEIKPKVLKTGGKVISGLASVIEGK
ncbi:uncharacterized protein LOC112518628 [Cynara cardunculus var. scolymus]|uniref:Uncharacterized protein n=1 Tax=Cynara cardunculus var. scolymus TaxID=59895 RepID=A0A124SCN4_CYNCS|nr:uncharacterized protein LOC112518628 [Cynara cardunculus var. scolymus]KVH94346.1 Protein of unknown function DUF506, plant [Cynara cardunculus var. scolymus]